MRRRRRQHQDDGIQNWVDRVHSLVQLGELSAVRQALEGANVAPRNLAILGALTNREGRLPVAKQELSQEILHSEPVELFELDGDALLVCLRTARRIAAPGPSGMTADHLFPILESEVDAAMFVQDASRLAVGEVPEEVADGIRLGRLTALAKLDGGVRGIVVGDIVGRLVARTMANRSRRRSRRPLLPSSTPCPTKQDASALHTLCRHSPTKTSTPQS